MAFIARLPRTLPVHRAAPRSRRRVVRPRWRCASAGLISVAELHKAIESPSPPVVLDVRGHVAKVGPADVTTGYQRVSYVADDAAYFGGHVPGACFMDWTKIDLSDLATFVDDMSERGVQRHAPVRVYDWGRMLFATRLWWALVQCGCTDVAVVDGGWHAWDNAGYDADLETWCPLKSYRPFEDDETCDDIPLTPPGLVTASEVSNLVCNHPSTPPQLHNAMLVDARSHAQYTGAQRRARRAGHIPGAVSVPYASLLREDGFGLRPDDELADVLRRAGLLEPDGHRSVVGYCNGGVASTLVLFALARCGVPLRRLASYDGSWNEWGNAEDANRLYPVSLA